MQTSDFNKLRDFVQTRLSSGVSPETLSKELLDALPSLTRANLKDLKLPWPGTESLSYGPFNIARGPFNPACLPGVFNE